MGLLASSHTVNFLPMCRPLLAVVLLLCLGTQCILPSGWCALGDPSAFEKRLEESGVDPGELRTLNGMAAPTHHGCSRFARLRIRGPQWASKTEDCLVNSQSGAADVIAVPVHHTVSNSAGELSTEASSEAPLVPARIQGEDPAALVVPRATNISPTASPPASSEVANVGPWFATHSAGDGEDAFLREALSADTSYPLLEWPWLLGKLKQVGSYLNITACHCISFKFALSKPNGPILPQALSHAAPDDDDGTLHLEESVVTPEFDHAELPPLPETVKMSNIETLLQLAWRSITTRISSKLNPPAASTDQTLYATKSLSETNHDSFADCFKISSPGLTNSPAEKKNLSDIRIPCLRSRRLLLQADISPPGMWLDSDADHDHFALLRGQRRLFNNIDALLSRARLRIRPPVIQAPVESFRTRALLADISPPGMWPDDDDGVDQILEFPFES